MGQESPDARGLLPALGAQDVNGAVPSRGAIPSRHPDTERFPHAERSAHVVLSRRAVSSRGCYVTPLPRSETGCWWFWGRLWAPPAGLPCLGTQLRMRVRSPRAVGLTLWESAAFSARSTSLKPEAAQGAAASLVASTQPPALVATPCGPPQLGRETDLSRDPRWITFQETASLC